MSPERQDVYRPTAPCEDRVAVLRPERVEDAYRKAAAEELIRARNEALTGMRQSGAFVIDVSPENASSAVVDRYLELKRKGTL